MSAILGILLILPAVTDINPFPSDISLPFSLLNSALLTVCFFHLFQLRRNLVNAHCLLAAIFNMMLTIFINFPSAYPHLPPALALWSGALFAAHILWERKGWGKDMPALHRALSAWLMLSPWPALPALLIIPVASLRETLLTLTLLTGIIGALGYRHRQRVLIFASRVLGLVLVHTWPVLFLPPSGSKGLVLLHIWPVL
ncbi:MAG: hypothetical protein GY795_39200, partial [Desulfobacterales bacterium]|nr:hypothetical protein [Desulfobacterales bacterium]